MQHARDFTSVLHFEGSFVNAPFVEGLVSLLGCLSIFPAFWKQEIDDLVLFVEARSKSVIFPTLHEVATVCERFVQFIHGRLTKRSI